jgi:acetyl esterase
MPELDLAERALFRAALFAARLPPSVQTKLAGGPIVKDGQELHPQIALLMKMSEAAGRNLETKSVTPDLLRLHQHRGARIAGGPHVDGPSEDIMIDGAAGSLRARFYPAVEKDSPLLLFLHGGGFVFGDLDTHDAPCRLLRRHAGINLLAVDYRLAPEHPFPAAVEDARAALRWAQANAKRLAADPSRIGIGGDSAGANLSAVTSQIAKSDGGPMPVMQLLVYPAVCRRTAWPSLDLFGEGFYLTRESIDWFHRQYSGHLPKAERPDPRRDPFHGEDLRGLPRALVATAGFDPLRDEGEAYAKKLREAGNDVTVRRFDGFVHGFFNMVGISPVCRDAVIEIAGATRILFSESRSR